MNVRVRVAPELRVRIATGKSKLFSKVRFTCARLRIHDTYIYSSAALSGRKNTLAENLPAMNVPARVAQAATNSNCYRKLGDIRISDLGMVKQLFPHLFGRSSHRTISRH